MSDDSFTPPRKKHNILWWLGGFFLLVVLLFLLQLFGPNPSIIVSPQTTHITQPLRPDGLPDYEQYLLDISRKGVTPENNAAPLLWQALFPGELEPKFHALMAAELGLSQVPSQADALTYLYSTANRQQVSAMLGEGPNPFGNDGYSTAADAVLDQTLNRPWTSEQLPPIAEWVIQNQKPLDLMVEASRRPRYYQPSATLLNNERDLLVGMLLPHVQSVREAWRSLPARAMWHLGEGRPDQAWQDLLALHRISHLLTQGHTLVEQLVAMAMSAIACDGTMTLLHNAELSPELASQIQRDLATLPSFAAVARTLDGTERLWALDAMVDAGSGSGQDLIAAIGIAENNAGTKAFDMVSVDWNLIMRESNRWYDRLSAAAQLSDRRARRAAMEKIDADIQRLHTEMFAPAQMLAGVVSRTQRSKIVAGTMLSMFLPALDAATVAEDRANAILDLTRLASALAVYRATHGEYPDKIEELVPTVLDQLPVDGYNAKPFIYQRHTKGYLLYSTGDNGVDEGGSNHQMQVLKGQPLEELQEVPIEQLSPNIPADADDIPVRARPRQFEWPKATPPQ